jgi:acyl-CoA hydrolase/RimJ/RimL family protein N-acetyltransferase
MVSDSSLKPWQERYAKKVRTADDAMESVKSGDRIFIGSGCAEPQGLVHALTNRANKIWGTEIIHIMTLGVAPYTELKWTENFRHNAFFIGPNVREAVAEGRADYTPVFLSEVANLFHTGRVPIDVALVQVTPPDEHGFCSFGVSVDVVKPAADNAELVIAQVNKQMPRTLGDSFIHVDDIDMLVEHEEPIMESVPPPADDIAKRIGRNIGTLVEDGATLQMGIGTIPDAVLDSLKDKKDLGVHTEMFSDGMKRLVDAGVITCHKKTLHKDKVIASFCMGTRKLYDFVDNNPFIEFHPNEYTNDPFIIAQNEKMVSINSALQVDVTGQVCADSLGWMFYSGIGGQLDFVRGAARSKGGKPIIALPSTAKEGTVSRITPMLSEGAGVVTTRGDVHYIVTEWGVAYLHGKNIRERALALINIAHPKFRKELMAAAKKMNWVPEDQPDIPEEGGIYPEELETTQTFEGGLTVFFRPIKPTDEPLEKDLLYSLSQDSIAKRFFAPLKSWSREEVARYVNIDYMETMAIVGMVKEGEREIEVAVGRYILNRATGMAEVAYLVRDDYQGKGIGKFLVRYLARIARANGVQGFIAETLGDNLKAQRMMYKLGYKVETELVDGNMRLVVHFQKEAQLPPIVKP